MKRICVYCGSSPGELPDYLETARELGRLLARRGIGLVYGGANVGLMGALADAVLKDGGDVIGVITKTLAKRVVHPALPMLHVVETMHERKAMMFDLSDAFIALPGGIGTLEEYLEVLTWAQLGLHEKPCGLLDVRGYFQGLLTFLDHAVEQRFIKPKHRAMILTGHSPQELLETMESYRAPTGDKWIDREAGAE